ncbi:MAG TPA: LysR family transcriptional regulator [Rhodobacterales bacterium]|nr:LysR family transcriptional regulator [Rhodobacterales bacterium]
MDWSSITFDWNRARAFLVTAEEGSLSAAARALGMTQPTLGRQVDALEAELGVALFERAGRGLILTPAGLDLLGHVRGMGEAATRLSIAAAGQTQALEGKVSITTSEVYAALVFPPILARLRREEPGIEIDIIATSATRDLRRREADIAVRNFRPTEPDLIARKLRDAPARLYATPGYLAQIGNPTTPQALSHADFISIDNTGALLAGLNSIGLTLTERNFPIFTDNYLVMWDYVKQGLGIGILDADIGDAEPAVARVLPDMPPLSFPIWLVSHRDLTTSRRIRRVFDVLAEELSKTPQAFR